MSVGQTRPERLPGRRVDQERVAVGLDVAVDGGVRLDGRQVHLGPVPGNPYAVRPELAVRADTAVPVRHGLQHAAETPAVVAERRAQQVELAADRPEEQRERRTLRRLCNRG